MSEPRTILFAGGGSGGHIFPNLAIIERLDEKGLKAKSLLLISSRSVDAEIASQSEQVSKSLPVQPLRRAPWTWPSFYVSWKRSVAIVRDVLREGCGTVMVATGGFVSGPAIAAARGHIPVALINLDAVPGKANRRLARFCSHRFSAHDVPHWPHTQRIGVPLRRSAVIGHEPTLARQRLELDPARETLLVTGGSLGARSINRMMIAWVETEPARAALRSWQVLHLSGGGDQAELRDAYAQAGIRAHVRSFCEQMGLAWSAATIGISRGGAGSVAEAWANAVPCIFLPYPYHRDEHQRRNITPVLQAGGCLVMSDQIDPAVNATKLDAHLSSLLSDSGLRLRMIRSLNASYPGNGADVVAGWVAQQLE